jgi:hypothetical protein
VSKHSFHEQIQPHVGRIAKVLCLGYSDLTYGQLGLLVGTRTSRQYPGLAAWVDMLIDGKIRLLYVYSGDLEFIGAEAGER